MDELEFYMDVSPEWWIKSRKDESFVKKYIYEKISSVDFSNSIHRTDIGDIYES